MLLYKNQHLVTACGVSHSKLHLDLQEESSFLAERT